jgi:Ca2+-binding EF-hand superfamily protein
MGGRLVLPEADEKMLTCIKTFKLKPRDIASIFKYFQKLDKMKTGLINLDDFFNNIEEKRSLYTDALVELMDVVHDEDGNINFSDFLCVVMQYCMFEPPEIMKFCYYVFDLDKGGIIDADELKALMNTLHHIKAPNTVSGNVKASWVKLKFNEDLKVDYEEFVKMNHEFPRLFAPAFRLQFNMHLHINGELWWSNKKRGRQNETDKLNAAYNRKIRKKEKKKKNAATRNVRKRMGMLRYTLCPCLRYMYEDKKIEMTEEERLARERAIALARRQADLAAKNPRTHPWEKFKKKIEPEQGGSDEYVKKKQEKQLRSREDRADTREERRQKRRQDGALKVTMRTNFDTF